MRVFLAGIPLDGARVVVIGEGEAALAKLRLFTGSPARLDWFTPGGAPDADRRPPGAPRPVERAPAAADFAGARLVFVARDDEGEARATALLARGAGAQVNVVDRPALSDFQTPALIDRDSIVVGIATGGAAPILARDLRSRIEGILPQAIGPLADIAGQIRDRVKAGVPAFMARRRFWERAFRGAAADMVAEGRTEAARAEMIRLMDAAEPEAGVLHAVGSGSGDPELLTLKALRILQDADVILHDEEVPDAVLARARRDAPRRNLGRDPEGMDAAGVARLVADHLAHGERVVRLYAGDPFTSDRAGRERDALDATGHEAFGVPAAMEPAARLDLWRTAPLTPAGEHQTCVSPSSTTADCARPS
jgi:uroporphyrin-III C-methyltransferase/precorrin-2 dehydrogenase/sirohydrochlorin ferrochelatase